MKAIIQHARGEAFVTMQVSELVSPIVSEGEVKVRMVSSRINPADMDLMRGFPGIKYKNPQIGGISGAGYVIEAGANVSNVKVGDHVYFYRLFSDIGAWAEEIVINSTFVASIPTNLSTEKAGFIALTMLTAYEAIFSLKPKTGERIFINGAGGGVGFNAVQIAKALGLHVIALAGTEDRDLLIAAGVDQLIDYTMEDFSKVLESTPVDHVLDVLGGEMLNKSIYLKPKQVVSTAFPNPKQMAKLGIRLPFHLKVMFEISRRKTLKLARKNSVVLKSQMTHGSGDKLIQVTAFIQRIPFLTKPYRTKSLTQIAQEGLTKNDVGAAILLS